MTERYFLLLAVLLLSACEAPLVLEHVHNTAAKAVHRTDVFQAAASHKDKDIVVGSFGVVLTSTDKGVNWQRRQLSGRPNLIDIVACADGSSVILSSEGEVWLDAGPGDNWQARRIDNPEVPQSIACTPDNRIWVVGSFGMIMESADQGRTWINHSLEDDVILGFIQFHDASNAVITGEFGTVLISSDGGMNWQRQQEIQPEFIPLGSYFKDQKNGWVVGLSGAIYSTDDGAQSWVREQNLSKAPLYGIAGVAGGWLYSVGDAGTVIGWYTGSKEADREWVQISVDPKPRSYLRVVHDIAEDKVLLAGGSGYLAVINKGQSGS